MTRLSSSLAIATSPDRIWPLLRETRSWPNWWKNVTHARTADLRPLREGSELEVTFLLGPARFSHKATVHLCVDNRALGWRARTAGLGLTWTWYLHPTANGSRMEMTLDVTCPEALLRWTRAKAWWTASTSRSLRQLKVLAERL